MSVEKKFVNSGVRKKDAMQLLLGKPLYTEDVTRADALVVKLLRSPHAHALIESIDTTIAEKVDGIVNGVEKMLDGFFDKFDFGKKKKGDK